MLILTASACRTVDANRGCLSFAEEFQSVPVSIASLDTNYLNQPLPEHLRKLEAGYDAACRIGGVADIYIQCPKGDNPRPRTIIRSAPVIGTDPEGFTVVIVSLQDHEALRGQDLFWARCEDDG
jgi:hypothetical protein